ncbi:hypothetical protein WMY93_023458 [Mugilogobius chulae]|uniref:Ig-like domain-containing protein n=1 Tax=Mugilogobius chulae TaxID=88201 RepID=A0AAW0NFE8_9GOBI
MALFGLLLLLLTHLLRTDSVSIQSVFVREGEDALLPCDSFRPGLHRCDGGAWAFLAANMSSTGQRYRRGQSGSRLLPGGPSRRVTHTDRCALQIQHVRPQEAGEYHCEQRPTADGRGALSVVNLFVVSVTEEEAKRSVKLQCEVFSSQSKIRVRWMFRGEVVARDNSTLDKRFLVHRKSVLSLSKQDVYYQEKHLLTCRVTFRDKSADFSLGHNTPDQTKSTVPPSERENYDDSEINGLLVRHIVLSLLLMALLLCVSVVHICSRIRGTYVCLLSTPSSSPTFGAQSSQTTKSGFGPV